MNRITLATLPQATKAQVFEQVARHLLKQRQKSLTPGSDSRCAYRGDGDLVCAAGCLIGPDEYDPRWENRNWIALSSRHEVPRKHFGLIRSLQLVHDRREVQDWPGALLDTARNFKIKLSPELRDLLNSYGA